MVYRPTTQERLKRAFYRIVFILSRPNTYLWIALGLVLMLVVGTVVIWELERGVGGELQLTEFGGAFNYMLQNVSGVWLGSPPPKSTPARGFAVFIIILAAATRALLVAALVSGFVNRILKQGKGKGRARMENHVIICGWNTRVPQVVTVLQREAFGAGVPIAILAELAENPLPNSRLTFIRGNTTHAEDLERAGVARARAAIAVTDESDNDPHMDSTYDARAVLTVLALKEANPKLHVVAQMRDPQNRHHFERARADEIIASAEMSEGLLARSALNVGIASAFSMLLRLDTPQELYIVDAPAGLEGKTFQAALVHQQLRQGVILLGVIEGGKTLLCPPAQYRIHGGTRLVVLGNIEP
jgi:voltage-gated potassium channel